VAITVDQVSRLAQNNSGANVTTTFSTNPSAGDKIVVYVTLSVASTQNGLSVTDNASNTYTYVGNASSGSIEAQLYYADNIKLPSSGSLAITVPANASIYQISAVAIAYKGAGTGLDGSATSNRSTTNSLSLSQTTSSSGELVCVCFAPSASGTLTYSVSGFTNEQSDAVGTAGPYIVAGDNTNAGTPSQTVSLTATPSGNVFSIQGIAIAVKTSSVAHALQAGISSTSSLGATAAVAIALQAGVSSASSLGGNLQLAIALGSAVASTSGLTANLQKGRLAARLQSSSALAATATLVLPVAASIGSASTLRDLIPLAMASRFITPPPPPRLQLLVNGQDLTAYLVQDQWSIDQQWSRQGTTAELTLADEFATTPAPQRHFTVPVMSTVQLIDLNLNVILFAGVVTQPYVYYEGPNLLRWELHCVDWTILADNAIVAGDFTAQRADQIVISLAQQAAIGLTTHNVNPGPVIPRVQIAYQPLSQALTTVSQYASLGGDTYGWWIDENLDLHFANQNQVPPPQYIFTDDLSQSGPDIGHYDRSGYYFPDGSSLKTRIVARGGMLPSQQTDVWVGNGAQTSWPLTFVPDTQTFQATLTVGGTNQSVSVDTGSSTPSTAFVISATPSGVYFLRVGTATVPASGTVISLTYRYLSPIIEQIDDQVAQQPFRALPNKGIFASYYEDRNIPDLPTVRQRAQVLLSEYRYAPENVYFVSTEDFTGHVRAGDLITFQGAWVPDPQSGNLNAGVNDRFLIYQCRIQGRPGMYRTYDVTAIRVVPGAPIVLPGSTYGSAVYGQSTYVGP
jgi:hypothetical protein